jgi:hypothetical protein
MHQAVEGIDAGHTHERRSRLVLAIRRKTTSITRLGARVGIRSFESSQFSHQLCRVSPEFNA